MCTDYAKASRLLQPMAAVMGKSHTTPLTLTANLAASKQVASNGMRQHPVTSSVSMAVGGGDVHEAAIADIEAAHQHVAPDDERWHPAAANVSSHPVTIASAPGWLEPLHPASGAMGERYTTPLTQMAQSSAVTLHEMASDGT